VRSNGARAQSQDTLAQQQAELLDVSHIDLRDRVVVNDAVVPDGATANLARHTRRLPSVRVRHLGYDLGKLILPEGAQRRTKRVARLRGGGIAEE